MNETKGTYISVPFVSFIYLLNQFKNFNCDHINIIKLIPFWFLFIKIHFQFKCC